MSERRGAPSAANVAPSGAQTVMDAELQRLAKLTAEWPEGTMALTRDHGAVRIVPSGQLAGEVDPANPVRLRHGVAFLAGDVAYVSAVRPDGVVDGYEPSELQAIVPEPVERMDPAAVAERADEDDMVAIEEVARITEPGGGAVVVDQDLAVRISRVQQRVAETYAKAGGEDVPEVRTTIYWDSLTGAYFLRVATRLRLR
jgi:hypothetical protein